MAIKKIPCGGFYVDDGAIQNVDGKPVLSAWNADLPKPSVGGYGYTDEDEIVHKIAKKYLPEADADPILDNAKLTGGIGWTDTDNTVHKIAEKYLPASGGAMVVEFTINEDETITTTHTVEQVSSAMKSGIVYAVLQQVRDGETVFACSGVMEQILFDDREEPVYDDGSPCLMTNTVGEDDGSRVFYKYPMVAVSNGEWIAGV